MPNWVHHYLTITGPEIERESFLAECFSEADFDFEKLIPQPEHIKGTEGAWYEWCRKNWGTKWNAYRTDIRREGEKIRMFFDTAWAPPIPIFKEVARRFPNLRIEGSFLDEMYNFGGDILCQNGKVEFEDRTEEIQSEFEEMMRAAGAETPPVDQKDRGGNATPF